MRLAYVFPRPRYGTPVVVLSLIKSEERRPREMILRREFAAAMKYVKEVARETRDGGEIKVLYIHWDFAKHARAKGPTGKVLSPLEEQVQQSLDRTGIFHAQLNHSDRCSHAGECVIHCTQCGVLRTNCIDCLDRTNVAQYVLGLCALRKQIREVRVR